MKKFSVKTIVAIGIGAALFFVLGKFVAIPSPVPNTSITTQYGLLAFMSVVYGPIAGALIGFIGHMLIDFAAGWGIWWSWVIASGVFGLLVGAAAKALKVDETHMDKKNLVKFNLADFFIFTVSNNLAPSSLYVIANILQLICPFNIFYNNRIFV